MEYILESASLKQIIAYYNIILPPPTVSLFKTILIDYYRII